MLLDGTYYVTLSPLHYPPPYMAGEGGCVQRLKHECQRTRTDLKRLLVKKYMFMIKIYSFMYFCVFDSLSEVKWTQIE